MSIESVIPSNRLILCRPLLLPLSIFPSIRVFSNESVLSIRWPKYWSFSFSISPSNEHSGLISFRLDWLDLLEVQGTPKSLLQNHSSKASILQCSAFFIVQLSHPKWLHTTECALHAHTHTHICDCTHTCSHAISIHRLVHIPHAISILIESTSHPLCVPSPQSPSHQQLKVTKSHHKVSRSHSLCWILYHSEHK